MGSEHGIRKIQSLNRRGGVPPGAAAFIVFGGMGSPPLCTSSMIPLMSWNPANPFSQLIRGDGDFAGGGGR